MHALLAAMAFLGFQVREQPIQDPIRNWTLHRKEINPRTGQEEVVAIVRGDEAIPRDKEVFDIRGVRAQYHTDPRSKNEKSETVRLEADRARLDGASGRLELAERVRVLHEDGTVLEAPAALVLFARRYVCAPCGTEAPKAGNCPLCNAGLRSKTATSVEVEQEFSLTRPGMKLSGRELRADDRLGKLAVGRQGFLEMAGRASSLAEKAAPPGTPADDVLTEVRCDGPLAIQDLTEDRSRVFLEARDNVRIRRRDAAGSTTTLKADRAEITAARRLDPRTGKVHQKPDPEKIAARGRLTLSDDKDLQASAEALDWETRDDVPALGAVGGPGGALLEALGAVRHDRALLSGDPVALAQGANRVRAKSVEIDRASGRTFFSGDVSGSFAAADTPGAHPLQLACRKLVATSAPSAAGWKPREIEALGDVRLEGLMEKEGGPSGRAEADRFLWNLEEQRGLLEGRPFVRVAQEKNSILAPRSVLEGRSSIVLKGPKRFRLVQKVEDRETATTVTSEGDVAIDSGRGRITLEDRCRILSDDLRLQADRMEIELAPEGKGLQALRASGNIRARRGGEAATVYGDRLRYDPKERALSVAGFPHAAAEAGGQTVRTREIRFNEQARTTELRGGEEGVLLVIDEAKK